MRGSAGAAREAARAAVREHWGARRSPGETGLAAAALGDARGTAWFVARALDLQLEVAEAVLALAFLLYPA